MKKDGKPVRLYRIFLAVVLVLALGAGIWYCWYSYRMPKAPEDGIFVQQTKTSIRSMGKTGWKRS